MIILALVVLPVMISNPQGTQDDYVKLAVDFRYYKKHAFVGGLV